MKKRSKFFVAFSAAALTFGTLMLTLGPTKFNAHGKCHYGHHHYHHCSEAEGGTQQ